MALVGTPKLHREFRGWCQNYRPVCGGYPASAGLKRLAAYLATGGATDSGRADRGFWLLLSSLSGPLISPDFGLGGVTRRGGGYVLLHAGAGGERRDGAEEEERISQRGTVEFPGIVVIWSPFWISSIKT
jgi:hypothetical protein